MKNSPYLVAVYLAIIVVGLLFALPNVLPASVLERWPSALPNKPVALGLGPVNTTEGHQRRAQN